ncbi:hypothetical protein acdb102_36050 [Acidothermaceae bacterium B102]|nr:hypothetical protein acdb102_36050 [Acidothermaceae bacterium B102]
MGSSPGHALTGSANPNDGIYTAPVPNVPVGSYALIRDPDLQNASNAPITIVSLHVRFPNSGAQDVGHIALVQVGTWGLVDEWQPKDGPLESPDRNGRKVLLVGAVIAPHQYFHSDGCNFAKIAITRAGTYVSSDLDITYRQGAHVYRQSLAGGYHLWTPGSSPPPGD